MSGDGVADWIAPDNDLTVNSSISTTWYVEEQYRNSSLLVTAVGQESGAVATQTFTDAIINTTTMVINSAPSGADTTITITENTPYTFSVADFGFTDPNDSPADGFQSVTITALPLDGTLTLNGTSVQAGDSITLPQAGVTWTAHASNQLWHAVASSADGTKLVAGALGGQLYTSTDAGVTWTARENNREWVSVASSADGTKLVAAALNWGTSGDRLYTSTDAGVTWTAHESSRQWRAVASSADGMRLVAGAYGGQLYTSSDAGVTWTAHESNRGWISVASSADGMQLVAADFDHGQLYISTDAGVTWTARESNRQWGVVASSADGMNLVAGVYGGQLYISTDAGVTWTARESTQLWNGIASSVDGMNLVAGSDGGQLYTSTDAGASWTAHESTRRWTGIASSADGTMLVAGAYGGQLYTSVPSPLGLVYTPAAGAHGTGLASISFHVQDSGGTANGGINRDQTANTITFNVTPVSYAINSAPSGADTTITITENTPYTFSVADFGFTDPNDSPADGFQSVTITALPLDGTLTLNGTPVQAGDSIILPQTGAGTASFPASVPFGTGSGPGVVTLGDVNGDGKDDLVVTNFTGGTVSVLLNATVPGATTPSFVSQVPFTTGGNPNGVALGDVNGDGKLDLAVGSWDNGTVSVWLNQTVPGAATPSFAPQVSLATGGNVAHIAFGDMNGDGKVDMVVSNYFSGTVSVLLNQTVPGAVTPSFAPQVLFAAQGFASYTALGDLNGDGKLDLAVVNNTENSTNVSVLLNQTAAGVATPSFAPAVAFTTGLKPYGIVMGDLNGDGKLDLAVTNMRDGTISALLNTTASGATTPSFAPQVSFAAGAVPYGIAIGDMNGDGKVDLVATHIDGNTVSVLLNTTTSGAITPSFTTQAPLVTGDRPGSVALGDLNGDGTLDLAVANFSSNTVSVLPDQPTSPQPLGLVYTPAAGAHGTGLASISFHVQDSGGTANGGINRDQTANTITFNVTPVSYAINSAPSGADTTITITENTPYTFSVADFGFTDPNDSPADGFQSVTITALPLDGTLTLNGTPVQAGDSIILPQTGAGTASFPASVPFGTGSGPGVVTLGDVNGDGKDDLVVTNFTGGTVSVLLNATVPGATTPSFVSQVPFTTGGNPNGVALGDVNGDGKLDLAVGSWDNGTVSVWLNQTVPGAATPSFAPQVSLATGGNVAHIAFGDMNGDGKVDMVVSNYFSGTVSVLLNQTVPGAVTPSFAPQVLFAAQGFASYTALGDLNGDGKLDLAVVNNTENSTNVSVLLNQTAAGVATPSFAPAVAFTTGLKPYGIVMGDLNGDGKLDLAVTNMRDGTISALLNTTASGATTPSFAPQVSFAAGAVPYGIAIGDMNGDGKVDLVATHIDGNTVSVLLNTTTSGAITPSFTTQAPLVTGDRPGSVALGDLNGDGTLDLAVANFSSNTVSVLPNQPTSPQPLGLRYTPAAGAHGTGLASISFHVQDSGGTANGGSTGTRRRYDHL